MTPHCRIALFLIFSSLFNLSSMGCASREPKPKPTAESIELTAIEKVAATGAKLPFVSHPNWLGLQLPPEAFIDFKQRLELAKGPLRSRGEAHITVLTPPEFQSFNGKIPMTQIEKRVRGVVQSARWSVICLGQGTAKADPKLKTYFVVVESPDLLAVRRVIKNMAERRGTGAEFNPEAYAPHITIAFTERDLHLQDGVLKDSTACQKAR
jgi:hypothetical protein